MSDTPRRALFADLVFNEEGQLAEVVYVGGVPHYVVPDGDFLRHVEAEYVDRQIVALMQERILAIRLDRARHRAYGSHPGAGQRGRG